MIQLRLRQPGQDDDVALGDQAVLRAVLEGRHVGLGAGARRIAGRDLAGQLPELLGRAGDSAPLGAQLQDLRVRGIPEKRGVRRQVRQLTLVVVAETYVTRPQ